MSSSGQSTKQWCLTLTFLRVCGLTVGTSHSSMGTGQHTVSLIHTHPRSPKFGGGSIVQSGSETHRMDITSSDCETDLEEAWQNGHGPVHFEQEVILSPVVFPLALGPARHRGAVLAIPHVVLKSGLSPEGSSLGDSSQSKTAPSGMGQHMTPPPHIWKFGFGPLMGSTLE